MLNARPHRMFARSRNPFACPMAPPGACRAKGLGAAALLLFLPVAAVSLQGCAVGIGVGAAAGAAALYDRRTTGTLLDDQIIEFKALQILSDDADVSAQTHINVTSFNGIVLLTGESPGEVLRRRAEELVTAIEKVRRVYNEVAIAAPSSLLTRSSDSLLTGKVKGNLLTAEDVETTRVKVVTENGTVYLMGLVTRAEGDAATRVTRATGGVQRVVKLFEYLN